MTLRWQVLIFISLGMLTSCVGDLQPEPTENDVIDTGYVHITGSSSFYSEDCFYPYEAFIIDATLDSVASYNWEDNNSNAPTRIVSEVGGYEVIITDSYGGTNSYYFQLRSCEPRVWTPNSFTPNGDALNQYWFPLADNVESIEWQIRNEDGLLIYEADDFSDKWNGRLPNGESAPQGFYMYYIKYSTFTEEDVVLTGVIELYR